MEERRVVELLEQVLDSRNRIDAEMHSTHHAFVQVLIEERRAHQERMERIKGHVIGWGAISAISGIGYAVWEWIRTHLK